MFFDIYKGIIEVSSSKAVLILWHVFELCFFFFFFVPLLYHANHIYSLFFAFFQKPLQLFTTSKFKCFFFIISIQISLLALLILFIYFFSSGYLRLMNKFLDSIFKLVFTNAFQAELGFFTLFCLNTNNFF